MVLMLLMLCKTNGLMDDEHLIVPALVLKGLVTDSVAGTFRKAKSSSFATNHTYAAS